MTASDLTPRMIELGRQRTAAEGLDITWIQADADAAVPSPFEWGDPDELRRRLTGLATAVDTEMRTASFELPSLESGWAFWEHTNGPWAAVKAMFPPEAYADLTQRALELMRSLNRAEDPRVRLEWGWLLVRARR